MEPEGIAAETRTNGSPDPGSPGRRPTVGFEEKARSPSSERPARWGKLFGGAAVPWHPPRPRPP